MSTMEASCEGHGMEGGSSDVRCCGYDGLGGARMRIWARMRRKGITSSRAASRSQTRPLAFCAPFRSPRSRCPDDGRTSYSLHICPQRVIVCRGSMRLCIVAPRSAGLAYRNPFSPFRRTTRHYHTAYPYHLSETFPLQQRGSRRRTRGCAISRLRHALLDDSLELVDDGQKYRTNAYPACMIIHSTHGPPTVPSSRVPRTGTRGGRA
ncbi:hypothetical protein C8F01DRAFT_799529 [Mycena amicta]|nr:hypothetical protein C8F01DRAFT_799529 [Mycena amicta]